MLWAASAWAATDDLHEAAQERLRFDWYRVEVVVFSHAQGGADGAARRRRLDAVTLPRLAIPLAEDAPPPDGFAFGQRQPFEECPAPLLAVDLPPPEWFRGDCAAEFWPGPGPDPCLWQSLPNPDLEGYFKDDPSADWGVPGLPPDELAAIPVPAVDSTLLAPDPAVTDRAVTDRAATNRGAEIRNELVTQLGDRFKAHEQTLFDTSYEWHRQLPELGSAARRLRRNHPVLAAGNWHQPLPPRERPQPLLVQVGEAQAGAPPALEGWFTVTLGRYIHFEATLLHPLAAGGVALLTESRAMRSRESHYLDHAAFGVLVRVTPLDVPDELLRLLDDLKAFDESAASVGQ